MGILDRFIKPHTNEKDHKEKEPSEQSLPELKKGIDESVPTSDEYIRARLSSINENPNSGMSQAMLEDPIFSSAAEKFRRLMAEKANEEANKAGSLEHETTETKTKTETEKPKGVFATNPNLKTVFKRNRSQKQEQEQVSDDGKDPR